MQTSFVSNRVSGSHVAHRKAQSGGSRRATVVQAKLAVRPAGKKICTACPQAILRPLFACASPLLHLRCDPGLKQPTYDGDIEDVDPEIASLIRSEKSRQASAHAPALTLVACSAHLPMHVWSSADLAPWSSQVRGLELIASENFTSTAVSQKQPWLLHPQTYTGTGTVAHARDCLFDRPPCLSASLLAGDGGAGLVHDQQVLGGQAQREVLRGQ